MTILCFPGARAASAPSAVYLDVSRVFLPLRCPGAKHTFPVVKRLFIVVACQNI